MSSTTCIGFWNAIDNKVCQLFLVMKCLSLKQPYVELLAAAKKTIEVRTWNTKFRGQFLVYAPKKIDEEASQILKIDQAKLVIGTIIGNANL